MWPNSDDEGEGAQDAGALSPRSKMLLESKDEEKDPTRQKAMTKQESTKMMLQKQMPRGLGSVDEDQFEKEVAKLTTEIEKDFLFLGQEEAHARNKDVLQMKGYEITHMLNIGTKPKRIGEADGLVCEAFDISDLPSEVLAPIVKKANKFISTAKKNKGKVLVFCKDDKPQKDGPTYSRSAMVLAGYIMATRKMNAVDAEKEINKCRKAMYQPSVAINHGFKRQLKALQKELGIPK